MKKLFCLFFVVSTVLATTTLNSPRQFTLTDSSVFNDLGNVAPGQTLNLIFSRSTGLTGETRAIFWETAIATLPDGSNVNSNLQGAEISLTIKIPENTQEGDYIFSVMMTGTDLRIIVPETYKFKVNVKKDVYSFAYEVNQKVNAGEPTAIVVRVTSSSSASDTFTITNTLGVPLGWFSRQNVYVPYYDGTGMQEPTDYTLTITPFEEGYYPATLTLGKASGAPSYTLNINFRVLPTLKSKLKAYSEGFSLVPMILQPFYSLLSFFGIS